MRPARRASDRDEAKYWRRRVDESGVAAYQRRHAAAYARRGGPVPCAEPAYPDFIVGLREHLPPADAPRPPVDADAAALQKTLHDLQFGGRCEESVAAYGIGRVGIGGVLEPMQAGPTIIEDNCFIGARSEVVEGCIVREGSVLGMGVFIGKSTKIVDRETGEVMYGEVPPYSVVVAGSMPSKNNVSLYCAVIVKRVDAQTRSKTGINELLRD